MKNNESTTIFKIEELEERLEMMKISIFGLVIYDNGVWFPQFQ